MRVVEVRKAQALGGSRVVETRFFPNEVLVPALPSSVIDPLWSQFSALLPERVVVHPLGCHRPLIPDRVVFDKLVQALVFGAAYDRVADASCSATTIRGRRDEAITAGVFDRLEQLCLEAYDRIVGLDLTDLTSRRLHHQGALRRRGGRDVAGGPRQ